MQFKKITDRWAAPEVERSVILDGSKKDALVTAFEDYDRKFATMSARADAVMQGFKSESDHLLQETLDKISRLLVGTPLEGVNPRELDIESDYAHKFGFVIVRPRPEESVTDLNTVLSRIFGARHPDDEDVIEIKRS